MKPIARIALLSSYPFKKLEEQALRVKGKLVCLYRNGSTNPVTLEFGQPHKCQVLGCPGEFDKFPPLVECDNINSEMECFTFKDGETWADKMKKGG